jgi:hypothetical protein
MNRTMMAFGLAGLLGAATAGAASSPAPGTTHVETRQLGGRVTFDVFHTAPYALTGGMGDSRGRTLSTGECTRETQWVGRNRIDSYSR